MIDIKKPIHYYPFPYDIYKGKEKYKSSVKKCDLYGFKQEGIKFIEDEIPDKTKETVVFYNEPVGIPFMKDVVKAWLKHNYQIEDCNNIHSISELSLLLK